MEFQMGFSATHTVPLKVLTVRVAFSVSVPLPCSPLYAFVPDSIFHRDMTGRGFVSIVTAYVIAPFLPFVTKRSRITFGSRVLKPRR